MVTDWSSTFGPNAYVIGPAYKRVEAVVSNDAMPKEILLSATGKQLASIADENVVCVRDVASDTDLFFRGERLQGDPKIIPTTIGPAFNSHVRFDGGETLIVSTDGGCFGDGLVTVEDLSTGKSRAINPDQSHIEIDVAFDRELMAVTGSGVNLKIIDFEGRTVAELKKPTLQRNLVVEFSPDRNRVLVGSWDTTLSVFDLNLAQ